LSKPKTKIRLVEIGDKMSHLMALFFLRSECRSKVNALSLDTIGICETLLVGNPLLNLVIFALNT
jgi:hypothetical protein